MATMAHAQQLSDAVLAFSTEGRFPDDVSALPPVSETDLQPAIEALDKANKGLEADIHTINEETREDVSSWVKNAKQLQEDIIRSKTIANDIVRQSEAPDVSGEAIQDAEEKAEFLNREVQYSQQLRGALGGIRRANLLLSEVEQAITERRLLDSLHLLEKYWKALDNVGVGKSCRVMKLLDVRAFELKSDVHEAFEHVWKKLVHVDMDAGKMSIHDTLNDEKMSLPDAVIALKSFKEVAERMEQLWRNLNAAIVSPRMDAKRTTPPGVNTATDVLELTGENENSVNELLSDLEKVLIFLAQKLPSDLLQSLCGFMMGDFIPQLIQNWLNSEVPSSLSDMTNFQAMIQRAQQFCDTLEDNGYTGFDELKTWVDDAPKIWLGKCRETALDTVRAKLSGGIGQPTQVEKIEKHMVSVSEGNELATTGAGAAADTNEWGGDWGDAWEEDDKEMTDSAPQEGHKKKADGGGEEDGGADAWGWDDDESGAKPAEEPEPATQEDEDDSADAWGWGDGDATAEPDPEPSPKRARKEETRELILKETYNISSMPEPVLELIFAILEDAAVLIKEGDDYGLVAKEAPGLLNLPTFALALFRAISPYYYSLDVGGNMFLYNDAMYLAEKLSEFSSKWKGREDLSPRARTLLRLDHDIKPLQSFANRSYANEMNVQKTVLQDLLGGSQSLMQQDDTESSVESGTARVRTMAATWEPILARSVWSQAIGSLADALSTRLLTDVMDMTSIGQEEAYNIAKLIASATELDDLFLPSKLSGTAATEDEVPATAQYAPSWLRLKYLSEVLQSNLNEVRYLWVESELSLYFTAEEVVDLVKASFEDNGRTRDTIKEIREKRVPLRAA